MTETTLPPRFWAKVDKTYYCWLWTGPLLPLGYAAQVTIRGRRQAAYRWTYEEQFGPIPEGLHIDHLCRVPACVNPLHLEAVTPAVNVRRGVQARNALKRLWD